MIYGERSQRLRRRLLNPWAFRGYLLTRLPLAACAGLRLRHLDETSCRVSLPGGWRTRNPFGSTYFAAQCMAAEMSTGVPAVVLVEGASASVAVILREIRGVYSKRIVGDSVFSFDDVAGLAAVVARAAGDPESHSYTGHPVARTADGTMAAEFEVTWSFKRRA
jgi:hypothetical protein